MRELLVFAAILLACAAMGWAGWWFLTEHWPDEDDGEPAGIVDWVCAEGGHEDCPADDCVCWCHLPDAEWDDDTLAALRDDTDLPGPDPSMPAPGAGEYQAWDELVQRDPERAALTLIAEWHDDTQERTVTGDVWDQWWAGVDGLERECMLVHDWLVREEQLWAELKAETRELCAA